MFLGRHRSRLDQIRARFDRRPGRDSSSLVEAEARLTLAVDRFLTAHAEEREATDRLTHAFDLIPQGLVLADVERTVVFRHRAASGFVDARHSEALVESAIAELIARAVTGVAENRTLDLFGPPRRAIQLRAGPLRGEPADQPVLGAFVLVEDVSHRQRLEAVRRDFVANISHELKTPIGAIGVLAENLVDETDPAVVRRLSDRMQREAFRLAHTIDDLLALSRIEVDTLPEPEPVDVASAIAEAVERTRPAAQLAQVRITGTDVAAGLVIDGDRRQLVSALVNVLDNAVKYSEASSEVVVSAARSDDHVAISVADHGIGIPTRDLERVFERFYRVDRARSRETGGTGLGLAIVRHVVNNHDGEIEVSSEEGVGTTFVLRFPAPTPPAGDPARPAQEQR